MPLLDNPRINSFVYRLSYRSADEIDSMIRIRQSIRSSGPQSSSRPSSIGRLDTLPNELLDSVLKLLDFRSLSYLGRVSQKGNAIVKSLPAYRDLTKHASAALIALSRTKLITFHSAASVYAEFRCENCVSCQNYAPFLFLPTCERCCFECLIRNRSLRVISRQMAGFCFGVSLKELSRIPIMDRLPKKHSPTDGRVTCRKPVRLVSVKQAKELGIAIHGSQEAMDNFIATQNAGKLTLSQLHTVERLTRLGSDEVELENKYHGSASTAFPSLRRKSGPETGFWLENGLWCLGCRVVPRIRSETDEDEDEDTLLKILKNERQARSKLEFIRHVLQCTKAKVLIWKMGKDHSYNPHDQNVELHRRK